MSNPSYSFLPYLRQGLANSIKAGTGARGTFSVDLSVVGDTKKSAIDTKNVEIYGPGDIVGFDPRTIVKTDPHAWVTNFEPNYLANIDFYSEDFPWRYTPTAPNGKRLNPWITLVVLEETEFREGIKSLERPLPSFIVTNPAVLTTFPKTDQLWAWAHVHVNDDITDAVLTTLVDGETDVDKSLDELQGILNDNPDAAYSRLMCGRKLKPGTSYHAFVIPSYQSGRLAGLGKTAVEIAAANQNIAWANNNDPEFPYYYRWKFSTGKEGDFEYLVKLLKPKVADSRVGRRVMDMTKPMGNLVWVEEENPDQQLGGILRLGGALQVPDEALTTEEIKRKDKFDKWATRNFPTIHPFQVQLARLLNLADDYKLLPVEKVHEDATNATDLDIETGPNVDADPLITPPIYGRWHAMVERVYTDKDGERIDHNYNWLNELNLDPRFRVPAHFGTRVVQDNQEDYMEAAWEQIGEVLNANKQIRYSQFGLAASLALYEKHFVETAKMAPSKLLLLTAPLQKRVMFNNTTLFQNYRESVLPDTVLSAPMRRIVRPRGRIAFHLQKQLPAGEKVRLEEVVTKINTGEIVPVPPKAIPPAMPAVDDVAKGMEPSGVPEFIKDLLRRFPWLPFAALGIALIILLLLLLFAATGFALIAGLAIAGGFVYGWRLLTKWGKQLKAADSIKSENLQPEVIDEMPKSNDFRLADVNESFKPTIGGATESAAGLLFKQSLKDMYRLFEAVKAEIPPKKPPLRLQLGNISTAVVNQLHPNKTIPAWAKEHIFFPPWIQEQLPEEDFVEAMAYPKINKPMYEDLKKISDELFLPNVDKIERNSMTLLETNQKFIESYMVGLNHEFARELLWREYPTDQRGSYFRQFWDVAATLKDPKLKVLSEEKAREPYYDIPKLHLWKRASKLGDHDHPVIPNEKPKEEVVLVIRGELLKKYPTTVVYAHRAIWTKNNDTNQFDVKLIRSLHTQEEGDKEKPDTNIIRTPLYSAKVDPDIYFFGFDLTVIEARGENEPAIPTENNAGWFFVIKERPGEARFGLDVPSPDGSAKKLLSWNDLDWSKVVPAGEGVVDVLGLPAPLVLTPPNFPEPLNTEQKGQKDQHDDDMFIKWNNNVDAANLAYIFYQVPMMVCTHAAEMLLSKDAINKIINTIDNG